MFEIQLPRFASKCMSALHTTTGRKSLTRNKQERTQTPGPVCFFQRFQSRSIFSFCLEISQTRAKALTNLTERQLAWSHKQTVQVA